MIKVQNNYNISRYNLNRNQVSFKGIPVPNTTVIELTDPKEIDAYLDSLKSSGDNQSIVSIIADQFNGLYRALFKRDLHKEAAAVERGLDRAVKNCNSNHLDIRA